MQNTRPWALVLGASSGFGLAAIKALATAGYHVAGVHLDRRIGKKAMQALAEQLEAQGTHACFYNINAVDEAKRSDTLNELQDKLGSQPFSLMMHSLAFGTLLPYVPLPQSSQDEESKTLTQRQMDMTLNVMAHSLVYWTQDLVARDMLQEGARILAMTSAGSTRIWPGYGAVSAAKCALESHIRQLAVELAPRGITANAICAGVTDTPAVRQIPDHESMLTQAALRNPSKRLTTPEDIAAFVVHMASSATQWMTGNTLFVDGGEHLVS